MGQITSIFDPNERRGAEELEYIDEEDEFQGSLSRTPLEEDDEEYKDDDDSDFRDCVCFYTYADF